MVAPSRGRGLKQPLPATGQSLYHRRPFTGAWIETSCDIGASPCAVVAPSRGRGLKQKRARAEDWGDGRPFTGAWIETGDTQTGVARYGGVAPSPGRGLKPLN